MQKLVEAFRGSAVLLTGETPAEKRQTIVDRFQQDDRHSRVRRQHHRRRHRQQPDGGHAGRVQRSRLGPRESLAGRRPRVSHRPDAHGQRHLHGRRRHDRRLRSDGAREEGEARQRDRRRHGDRRRTCPATSSTSCSARCASCRRASADSRPASDGEHVVERLLRRARLDLDGGRGRDAGVTASARPKRRKRSGGRSRRSPRRFQVRRSSVTGTPARRTRASSTRSPWMAPTSPAPARDSNTADSAATRGM